MDKIDNNASFGENFLRITLAGFFLWMGFLKFFAYEIGAVSGLMTTSPITNWFVSAFGNSLSVGIIGVVEIIAGLFMLIGCKNTKLGVMGAALAILTLVVTSTFLIFGPVIQEGHSFPFLSPMPGQFILKDVPLLGAAVYLFLADRGRG